MRRAYVLAAVVLFGSVVALDSSVPARSVAEVGLADELVVGDAPAEYHVDYYLQAAACLQCLGKERACQQLRAMARRDQSDERVIVLCRMLFRRAFLGDFQRPLVGGPIMFGGTQPEDWPLEPIEIVDGIPFNIVHGYVVGGYPEWASKYVDYCVQSCVWSSTEYRSRTQQEKQQALEKLLASPKWRTALRQSDCDIFAQQIR